MPQRNIESQYPYAYQGQEKDAETGMEAFELRLWDARIGRWLTTDPVGEFYSPYLGMGNNPVGLTDPDGGKTDSWIINGDTGDYTYVHDGSDDIYIFNNADYGNFLNTVSTGISTFGIIGYFTTPAYSTALNVGARAPVNSHGMVELPNDNGTKFDKFTFGGSTLYNIHNKNDMSFSGATEQDQFGAPENIVKFMNLAINYKNSHGGDVLSFGDLSTETGGSPRYNSRGTRHKSHYNGSQADIRYPTVGGNTNSDLVADVTRTQFVVNHVVSLGGAKIIVGNNIAPSLTGFTGNNKSHNNHIHIGF